MSSSDFSEIALKRERGRSERLFRAAVTAFASRTRPSRKEVAQLDDLALPLYDAVSPEGRRFVAAVLSELDHAPAGLVRRLADESVDIAAPVLLRSQALADIDLVAMIGRHGLPHARVIARRQNLNPAIAQLAAVLARSERRPKLAVAPKSVPAEDHQMKPAEEQFQQKCATVLRPELRENQQMERFRDSKKNGSAPDIAPAGTQPLHQQPGSAAEDVRAQLRALMRPAAPARPAAGAVPRSESAQTIYAKLRESSLTGVHAFFQTALADALGIGFGQARSITAAPDARDLVAALKFLELSEDQAFVVAAALHPGRFAHAEAIRLFLDRYRLLHREAAADLVRGWKEATLATVLQPRALLQTALNLPHAPANNPGRPAFGKALKAS